MKENSIEEDVKIVNNFIAYFNKNIQDGNRADLTVLGEEIEALNRILSDYKRVLKENEQLRTEVNSSKKEYETYKKQYFCLINRIENKIDKFDYEFEKAKRQNDKDKSDYYWDLIINFKKLL